MADLCRALTSGTVADRPCRKRRAAVPREEEVVAVILARGPDEGRPARDGSPPDGGAEWRVLVRRRSATGLLAGMFEFPGVRVGPDGPEPALDALVRKLGIRVPAEGVPHGGGGPGGERRVLPPVPHAFSHLHLTYRPTLLLLADDSPGPAPSIPGHGETGWVTPSELQALPLPVAQQSIVDSLRAAAPEAWTGE